MHAHVQATPIYASAAQAAIVLKTSLVLSWRVILDPEKEKDSIEYACKKDAVQLEPELLKVEI